MWINPKIIIGNTATGRYYYPRPDIVELIWDEIDKGNHVLIAAPRRVGKSSVMKHMTKNAPSQCKCIFENVQGIDSEQGFYKVLYDLIKSCMNNVQKSERWLKDIISKTTLEEISIDGNIKLGTTNINYLDAINNVLPKLNGKEVRIVLFVDELPEVLHKLHRQGKTQEASSILKNLRRWRQDDDFKNFSLVLAGSIGIHHVVKSIEGRTTDTNDFGPVDFESLSPEEARNYIQWATDNGATIQYTPGLTEYLLLKIEYHLPYFINLMLDQINKKAKKEKKTKITTTDIDDAFDHVVKTSDHFRDWKNRIFNYMAPDEAAFQNSILCHIAYNNIISVQKVHDLAVKYNTENNYIDLLSGLERDGYIKEKNGQYIFLSPFLKSFWKRENPLYNES
jgi:uncharacterized protein